MIPEQDVLKTNSVQMTILVTPDLANFSGEMHGGELLKFLDKVAYTCAMRYSGHYVVTLSVDKVLFKQPIHIGELLTFLASVNYTGRTSMEIGIKVIAEDLKKRSVRHTNSCYFTMVALDENRKPVAIEPFKPETEEEKSRYKEAEARRAMSLKSLAT
ncbi:acyl-CoA thioesterase [Pseudobacteriovorax antillogorgiicola]|uniref:Acyl-CoA hydrolase n=1 Tax=Pseudobacteriovorax antillogorgiicola TaxID=1513793 RepID=A0A1Y6BPR1_9BACT|nr:acyl-CoA thioesterase [Pseudobacteriovorax antillogorgiicola]TCS54506.1 acyl-CoA hydrolase [Pseudobacteriovorax antillogorgiicola]SMF19000.1 Acyl-CoA hydrolase [Pseudobacteriovorax antillogorgiicola]